MCALKKRCHSEEPPRLFCGRGKRRIASPSPGLGVQLSSGVRAALCPHHAQHQDMGGGGLRAVGSFELCHNPITAGLRQQGRPHLLEKINI